MHAVERHLSLTERVDSCHMLSEEQRRPSTDREEYGFMYALKIFPKDLSNREKIMKCKTREIFLIRFEWSFDSVD